MNNSKYDYLTSRTSDRKRQKGKTELSARLDGGGLEATRAPDIVGAPESIAHGTFVFQHPPLTEAVKGKEGSS